MKIQSTPTINHISAIIKLDNLSDNLGFIESLAKDIINDLELTVVKKIDNKFEPIGRTLVYILSESYLTIHACPESKISGFDSILSSALRGLKVYNYQSEFHRI